MRPKLTCLIPCKNERLNIRPCIESFQNIADEILVADSGSTDGTLDIVRDIGGCRIIEREYIHSGNFKNWAIPQAAHEWVLLLDADERVTPELASEILQVLETGPPKDGYWIYRKNYYMGHPVHSCGWHNDCCLRLFHRDKARYIGEYDHAEIQISTSKVGRLKNRMEHYTYWSYDQLLRKYERYTKVQAQLWYQAGRRPSYWQLLLRPAYRFVRDYIFQRGFLEGKMGLQIATMHAFYAFMKQARLWELHHAIDQPDPELDRNEDAIAVSQKKLYFEELPPAA